MKRFLFTIIAFTSLSLVARAQEDNTQESEESTQEAQQIEKSTKAESEENVVSRQTHEYSQDILGGRYESKVIEQEDDYEGQVISTIIRQKCESKSRKAIIYVHGYNDYFFQSALGDSANAHGYNFYAVDLRKYGRSLLDHQDAFFCKNLEEYFPDIDSVVIEAKRDGNDKIILMGHSTGGLISSLYMADGGWHNEVSGLILNSPFLDWNESSFKEKFLIPTVSGIGKIIPKFKAQGGGKVSNYAISLLKTAKGEWEYNTKWKKPTGHPKKAAWVRAIHHGHKRVQGGMKIACPIFVMSSNKSTIETKNWKKSYTKSDIVLDISEIQKYGKKLGKNVTRIKITEGLHDLILSREEVRDEAYKQIFSWLNTNGL